MKSRDFIQLSYAFDEDKAWIKEGKDFTVSNDQEASIQAMTWHVKNELWRRYNIFLQYLKF